MPVVKITYYKIERGYYNTRVKASMIINVLYT